MAKKKVFLSYDYKDDKQLKGCFVSQAKNKKSPFSINDVSLKEAYPSKKWVSKAEEAIRKCELFIVLLGRNTHNAPGVHTEVNIAKRLNKERIQVRPKGKKYGTLKNAGKLMAWKWKNFRKQWGQS